MASGCDARKELAEERFPHNIGLKTGKVFKIGGKQVVGTQVATFAQTQTAVVPTFTANDPEITANGAVTIADGDTPTVVELLEFCVELNAQLAKVKVDNAGMLAALKAHGLVASA